MKSTDGKAMATPPVRRLMRPLAIGALTLFGACAMLKSPDCADGAQPIPANEVAVFFGFDDAKLGDEGRQALARFIADEVRELAVHERLRVEAHTDSQGPAAYNRSLAAARAAAVARRLEELGVNGAAIDVVSFGEDSAAADAAAARSRRVDVLLIPHRFGDPALAACE